MKLHVSFKEFHFSFHASRTERGLEMRTVRYIDKVSSVHIRVYPVNRNTREGLRIMQVKSMVRLSDSTRQYLTLYRVHSIAYFA
jgi:hypothetical protein